MNASPPANPLLAPFSEWVAGHLGLHFPPERYDDLQRGVGEACSELGFGECESCMRGLMSMALTRERSETLASYLTVGETYFFRDRKTFEALEKTILPQIIEEREFTTRSIRIWSAGCSTGEEPYSIAILLYKMIRNLHDWKITILATDINPRAIRRAETGIYGTWSFRETPEWVRQLGFQPQTGGRYELQPCIRRMVTFTYLNLAEDVYPSLLNNTGAMDVILCRNVLMYFVHPTIRRVLHKLSLALVPGGWLNLSPCDAFHLDQPDLQPAQVPDVTFFRKRAAEVPLTREQGRLKPPPTTDEALPLQAIRTRREELQNRIQPDFAEQATESLREGRYTETAELAFQHLRAHPTDSFALEVLARSYANQGRLVEALEWCDQGLRSNRLNSRLHYVRGTILQEQGKLPEAIDAMKRVIYLEPGFVLAHFAMGNLLHQLGRDVEAQAHFGRALALLELVPHDQVLPESEGITAGRLREIILSSRQSRLAA